MANFHSGNGFKRIPVAQRQAGGPAFAPVQSGGYGTPGQPTQARPNQNSVQQQAAGAVPHQGMQRVSPGVYRPMQNNGQDMAGNGQAPSGQRAQMGNMGNVSPQDQAWVNAQQGSYGNPQPFQMNGAIGQAANYAQDIANGGVGSWSGNGGGQPGRMGGMNQDMNAMSPEQMAMQGAGSEYAQQRPMPNQAQGHLAQYAQQGVNRNPIAPQQVQGQMQKTFRPIAGQAAGIMSQPPMQNGKRRVSPGVYR